MLVTKERNVIVLTSKQCPGYRASFLIFSTSRTGFGIRDKKKSVIPFDIRDIIPNTETHPNINRYILQIDTLYRNEDVVNSFILCSTISSIKLPKTHLEFRELLITHLIEPNRVKRILQPAARPTRHMSTKKWELKRARLLDAHFPYLR